MISDDTYDWREDASCSSIGSETFFPVEEDDGRHVTAARWAEARRACGGCPVRQECLDVAMQAEAGTGRTSRYGMYGGLTPRERWKADPDAGKTRGGPRSHRAQVHAMSARGLGRITIAAELGLHPDSVTRILNEAS